jgi:replicative DNA helicase Mcm
MSTDHPDLVHDLRQFLKTYHDKRGEGKTSDIGDLAASYPKHRRSLTIDYDDLYRFNRDIAADYLNQPSQIRAYLQEAVRTYDIPLDVDLENVMIRLENLTAVDEDAQVTVADAIHREGKLAVVEGQVARVSQVDGIITEVAFECQRCGTLTDMAANGDEMQEPHECSGCERQGPFSVNYDKSTASKCQKVRLQEPPEEIDGDRQPAKMEMLIKGKDLCAELNPGDRARVAAHLKRSPKDNGEQGRSTRYTVWGDVQGFEKKDTDFSDLEISDDEIEWFHEIADENPAEAFIQSIKPTHHGHELIKEALAMQMFGGVSKTNQDGSEIRGESHLFLVGDPGMDKSGLLKYTVDATPRSIYTVGNNSSKAGMTCAAVRDDWGASEWTIRGGALVQANGGLCAIDEFDKMDDSDMTGLNEALADGTVSPSKAGQSDITLPAKTTVIGAANPVHGRFDEFEPIGEQLDFDPTVLSRFDLIFTLTDSVDEEEDRALAEHILNLNQDAGRVMSELEYETDGGDDGSGAVLGKEDMQKYVAYARREFDPVVTDEANTLIEDFYVRVRSKGKEDDKPVPITARKLEALVRLSEASARLHLSDKVTATHAMRAIDIVRKSMQDVGVDPETDEFDADVVETGTSKTQKNRIKNVKDVVSELETEYDNGAPKEEVLKLCVEKGLNAEKAKHEIGKLLDKGEIYQPQHDHFRVSNF